MTRIAVLDLPLLPLLHEVPDDIDAVLIRCQPSSVQRAALTARFRSARLVDVGAQPSAEARRIADRAFVQLPGIDVEHLGVPVIECLRWPFREHVEMLGELRALAGDRAEVWVHSGSRMRAILDRVASAGADISVHPIGASRPGEAASRSFLRRLQGLTPRGTLLAIESRLDAAGTARARLTLRPRVPHADLLLAASYTNPSRAALELRELLGADRALLVTTGPGALSRITRPAWLSVRSLSSAIAFDRKRAVKARSEVPTRSLAALDRWETEELCGAWSIADTVAVTPLASLLRKNFLPALATGIVGLGACIEHARPKWIGTGDEFPPLDRALLLLGKHLGIATATRQHGVLDSHYLREAVIADHYWAWDPATTGWLRRHAALGATDLHAAPRAAVQATRPPQSKSTLVFFTQPYEMVGIDVQSLLDDVVPAILRFAGRHRLSVLLKPHPLQSVRLLGRAMARAGGGSTRIETQRSASETLDAAALALTLDSSVVVDCRERAVPCVSLAWYAGGYVEDLVEMGYVRPCRSPEGLEEALEAAIRFPRNTTSLPK